MTTLVDLLNGLRLKREDLENVEVTPKDEAKLRAAFPMAGRYRKNVAFLDEITSLSAWAKSRACFTIEHFIHLWKVMDTYHGKFRENKIIDIPYNEEIAGKLRGIYGNLSLRDIKQMEIIEDKSEHDLAAATDWLKYKIFTMIENGELPKSLESCVDGIHFGNTSEDVNYNVFQSQNQIIFEKHLIPLFVRFQESLIGYAEKWHDKIPGLTHGQPAEPTTISKFITNCVSAIDKELQHFLPNDCKIEFYGKLMGAVGNASDAYAAYPDINWVEANKEFIQKIGLIPDEMVTQTGSFTDLRHYYSTVNGICAQIIKFSEDFWKKTSFQWFRKKPKEGAKGSSVMPNKYNPWRLEGGVAYIKKGMTMLDSTWQQLVDYNHEGDMARSIIMRDVGDDFSKIIIGIERILDELNLYEPNYPKIKEFLDQNPGLVGGAAQTILKRAKVEGDPYRLIQQMSIRTDGAYVTRQEFEAGLRKLIDEKKIPNEVGTEILYRADPANNVGYAHNLAERTITKAKLTISMLKEVYA